ncbi:hypothetical protein TNCV_1587191 [Trichonephila clavipes]|nr:hypothetical protein TNCV_1587191 [Trichonephila clavipes]
MPLDNKCRIGPLAAAPPDTCAVVISTETESGFSSLKMTRLQSVTLQVARGRQKIQSTLPMMWGQCYAVMAQPKAQFRTTPNSISRSSRQLKRNVVECR